MCGDAHCEDARRKRYDPTLKLFVGVPVMFNSNKYIDIGLANGTPLNIVSVNFKRNGKQKVGI